MAVNIPVPDYSNATTLEQKFEILADSYNMLRKELDYVLQNLSTENFNSIFANNITAKNLKGGNININDAFLVDGEGNVEMNGTLNIAGLITVDEEGNMTIHGGQMTWVSSDPKLNDIDIELSDINGYLTDVNGELITIDGQLVSMSGNLSDISVVANLAGTNIVKLSNGTYLGGTFINGKKIQAPEIYGGKIEGIDIIGSYFRGSGANSAYIKIGLGNGSNLGDLALHRGVSDNAVFQIYDDLTVVILKALGINFLESSGSTTRPKGNWDFSGANVTGVPLRFSS